MVVKFEDMYNIYLVMVFNDLTKKYNLFLERAGTNILVCWKREGKT